LELVKPYLIFEKNDIGLFKNKIQKKSLISQKDAANSAISVDLGAQYVEVALVKPGVPMEIVLDKASRRKTPLALALRRGERLFSDSALNMV
jgi:hypoxia up-regulated 1